MDDKPERGADATCTEQKPNCQGPTARMETTSSWPSQGSVEGPWQGPGPQGTQQLHPILAGLLDFSPHIIMGCSVPTVRKRNRVCLE